MTVRKIVSQPEQHYLITPDLLNTVGPEIALKLKKVMKPP